MPRRPGPDEFNTPPELVLELAGELGLSEKQRAQLRDLRDEARKQMAKVHSEIEVLAVDLHRELEKDEPDENKVGELLDKMGALEGQARKTHVMTGLRARRILTKDQRKKLEEWRRAHRPEPPEPPAPPPPPPPPHRMPRPAPPAPPAPHR